VARPPEKSKHAPVEKPIGHLYTPAV
jgi:hypothetical protein